MEFELYIIEHVLRGFLYRKSSSHQETCQEEKKLTVLFNPRKTSI